MIQVRVVVQVLTVDVGDHGENRRQLEERPIAFVAFHHQIVALTQARIGAAHHAHAPADHHGGVQPGVGHNSGDHGSGGGLAMAAGDGDAKFQAHQLGKEFAAREHVFPDGAPRPTPGLLAGTAELTTTAFAEPRFPA